jgi:hypothetical protein
MFDRTGVDTRRRARGGLDGHAERTSAHASERAGTDAGASYEGEIK